MPPVCTVGVGLEVSLTCSQTVTYLPPFAVDDSLLQQLTSCKLPHPPTHTPTHTFIFTPHPPTHTHTLFASDSIKDNLYPFYRDFSKETLNSALYIIQHSYLIHATV